MASSRDGAKFLHRLRLVVGLQRRQRGPDLARAFPMLLGQRRRPIGVEDGLVGGRDRQPRAGLGRFDPGLEGLGLRPQPQGQEEPRSVLDQGRVGDAEIDEVLCHLDRRGGHRVAVELLRPQEVGALKQAMILGRALLPEAELGLLDGVLETALRDQAFGLLAKGLTRWGRRF